MRKNTGACGGTHGCTHARMHTRACTQTRSALREQEQTAWASRMKSRMQGVEAMLDQVFLAASYGLGGDTPFTWPLAGATGGWRVPSVHGLAGHPSTGITEVLAPKWRCPGCRTRHGMLLVYGMHHWYFLFFSSHVPVTFHAAWHGAARRGSERLRSSTRAPKHSERGLVHARTHARTPARTHVTLRLRVSSRLSSGRKRRAPTPRCGRSTRRNSIIASTALRALLLVRRRQPKYLPRIRLLPLSGQGPLSS